MGWALDVTGCDQVGWGGLVLDSWREGTEQGHERQDRWAYPRQRAQDRRPRSAGAVCG